VKNIYFEGNINSYTYADEGASLYDVLNLYNEKHHLIRDVMIKSMKDLEELEEYIESTEDVQLGMMLDIVNEYGNEIPAIIKEIKDKNCEKDNAEIIFSTVHRCKGMEYDSIELADDFITEKKLKKIIENQKDDKNEQNQRSIIALNEEINLLYVAITRTKNIINIQEELVPRWLPHSNQIKIITKPIVVDTSSKLRERIYGKDNFSDNLYSNLRKR
jgi:superfamily I DNA/RNA helicase